MQNVKKKKKKRIELLYENFFRMEKQGVDLSNSLSK